MSKQMTSFDNIWTCPAAPFFVIDGPFYRAFLHSHIADVEGTYFVSTHFFTLASANDTDHLNLSQHFDRNNTYDL